MIIYYDSKRKGLNNKKKDIQNTDISILDLHFGIFIYKIVILFTV